MNHSPLTLIILDGWGYQEDPSHNAIAHAKTPFWEELWRQYPHTLAVASGLAVGLPKGQMGNSEVGHLHMGAGRMVPQDLTRLDLALESGEFYENPVFGHCIDDLIHTNHALHIFGLLSPGGVHSHENHIQGIIRLAAERGLQSIYVHAFLDGRDTPPQSAKSSLMALESLFRSLGCGKIVSLTGRYYAMDRDKRWDRTKRAYDLITIGETESHANSALAALEQAYARSESDEFVQPTAIHSSESSPVVLKDGDAVIFMNFRADRARQLSHALLDVSFPCFMRQSPPKLSHFITLTEYSADLGAEVAFPPLRLNNMLGEYIAQQGLRQLRIAETEKYAHVTFFFNGGEETVYPGEERQLIPSPKVATYDLQPEMSAVALTDALIAAIKSRQFDFIVCNFANPDMVGHTGNFSAAVKAIETIDVCLERVIQTLQEVGGEALITADHGNAECMHDSNTGQAHTAHTTNLVPVLYVGRKALPSVNEGVLYDIAPTVLYCLGLEKPSEMTGKSLFYFD